MPCAGDGLLAKSSWLVARSPAISTHADACSGHFRQVARAVANTNSPTTFLKCHHVGEVAPARKKALPNWMPQRNQSDLLSEVSHPRKFCLDTMAFSLEIAGDTCLSGKNRLAARQGIASRTGLSRALGLMSTSWTWIASPPTTRLALLGA